MKNPKWQRDELILALDLYFKYNPLKINAAHKDVIRLSEILNLLPIHSYSQQLKDFRNPNGVYMKLCNFLRFDPKYKGKGLERGGKLEQKIWEEFLVCSNCHRMLHRKRPWLSIDQLKSILNKRNI